VARTRRGWKLTFNGVTESASARRQLAAIPSNRPSAFWFGPAAPPLTQSHRQ